MTMTFELDLHKVKVSQPAEYLGQRSFSSNKLLSGHRHTRRIDGSTWTTKLVDDEHNREN